MSSWGCTKMEGLSSLLLLITIIVQCLVETHAVAVMSVDFGNEWMKVAIVSPGVPMEIALNKESKRKTPVAIAFRDNERTFGEDAISVGVRFPKQCYMYLLDLLGKKVDNPVVKMYQERFPYYDIVPDPERGTVLFQHDSETQFSVEELVGMMLKKAQDMAIASAGQAVNEAVITVPGYFNQAERRAMLHAAELAGVKVLQLINDYTAVALNYGIFRRKDFNETAQYIMFYDMGASSTTATVVSYQITKVKEKGIAETHPQLTVLGVGYDRNLGGLEKQLRLRDYLGKKFNEMKKTPNDVLKNPRAMAKLFKEAGRLKNVLSANADHFAQVEGLLDEIDFKLQVTRDQFENMCSDLFERVKMPALNALKSSGLTLDVINQVILAGAGTRVPAVQDRLTAMVGSDLGKNLNTDEAAVLGAVYKAADLSAGFKVKKFITKDAVLFPIQVTFEREAESGTKLIKRTLFGPMNPYPQKRILTFNKHTNDFDFHVGYGELEFLDQFHLESLGSFNLSKITLSGVADAIAKHQGPKSEIKGVKAHFLMDDSGILTMTSAELVVEKTITEEELKVADESPLSKLGSTISNFFTGPDESKHETVQEEKLSADDSKEEGSDKREETGGTEGGDDTGNRTNEQEGGTGSGSGSGEEKEEEKKKEEEGGGKEGGEGGKKQPKVVTLKEPIASREESFVQSAMKEATLDQSRHKLNKLNSVDEERRKRESVLNALESSVFETKMRLETDEYGGSVAPEEKAKIAEAVDRVSVWLDEDSYGSSAEELTTKLKDLQRLTDLWYRRVQEHRERPEALSALFSMINGSRTFLSTIKNMSIAQADSPQGFMFTTIEIETLEKAIVETEDWKDKQVSEQEKLALYENPKLTVKMMMDKMASLDREVQYLVNKAKIWKPKQTEQPLKEPIIVPATNETEEKTNRTEEVESKDAEAKEPEQPPQVEELKESKKESKEPKEERKEEPKMKDVKVEEIPTVEDAKKETPSLPETKELPPKGTESDEHTEL